MWILFLLIVLGCFVLIDYAANDYLRKAANQISKMKNPEAAELARSVFIASHRDGAISPFGFYYRSKIKKALKNNNG
ncbi:MAG TPA: hypothetical protein VF974_06530 [Patescibacteria group bacterium]